MFSEKVRWEAPGWWSRAWKTESELEGKGGLLLTCMLRVGFPQKWKLPVLSATFCWEIHKIASCSPCFSAPKEGMFQPSDPAVSICLQADTTLSWPYRSPSNSSYPSSPSVNLPTSRSSFSLFPTWMISTISVASRAYGGTHMERQNTLNSASASQNSLLSSRAVGATVY